MLSSPSTTDFKAASHTLPKIRPELYLPHSCHLYQDGRRLLAKSYLEVRTRRNPVHHGRW